MATILLIEDEPGTQEFFKTMGEQMGHHFICADDGPSGLVHVPDPSIDLIMTDLNMPGEPNGMDLVREIRRLQPDLPMIVVSGYPTPERLNECKRLSIGDFLTKPFELTFFSGVVERLLADPCMESSSGF